MRDKSGRIYPYPPVIKQFQTFRYQFPELNPQEMDEAERLRAIVAKSQAKEELYEKVVAALVKAIEK